MSDFIQALKKAVSVIPNDANILLQGDGENLEISAVGTGLDVRFTITSNYKLDCCVNGKVLCDFLQSAKATDIVLEQGKHSLIARFGDSELELPIYPTDSFPDFPDPTGDKISVFSRDLISAFKKVDFIPLREWYQPFKATVLFEYQYELLKIVATDDHRLAVVKIIVDEEKPTEQKKILLSKDTISKLKNILPDQGEVSLLFTDKGLFFNCQNEEGTIDLFANSIVGEFPNYERVLPGNELDACNFEVLRDKLIQSLNRVFLITDVVKINVDDKLEVSGESEKGKFTETIPTFECNGKVNALFNVKYLLQPLTHLEDEKVVLRFNENNFVSVNGSQYIYVLCPVEVPNA